MTGLAFQKHGGTFLMVIGSMCSPAHPDVLVFGHYAYGRSFLGRYPARHAPALDTHRAKHATSPKAHTADVADSTLPRAAGFPVLTRPNWKNTGVPTHAEMPSHSRASGQRAPFPTPRASRAHADCRDIVSGKRGASTHESPEKRMCDSQRRQCIIPCSR